MSAYTHTIYHVTGETEIRTDPEQLSLTISDGMQAVSLQLPASDEDAGLFLDLASAALDNARSLVGLRHANRERAVVGWNGAGSDTPYGDMEANRG